MLKKKIEALLFSSGRKMAVGEISTLCKKPVDEVTRSLHELKEKFNDDSSIMLIEDGDFWKLTPKEDYLHLVSQIVTKTELSKTLMETLAIIAYKYPIKQSDLIKMRTNKAYDHLRELEESGYITRQKYGRTKLIKLTQKFFEYFSLKEENLKEKFKDFDSIAQKIEEKEDEIKKIRADQKEKAKEAGKKDKEIEKTVDGLGKEVDLIDEKGNKVELDVVAGSDDTPQVEEYKDTLGELEIIDEPEVVEGSKEEIKEEVEPNVEEIPKTPEEKVREEETKDEVEKRVEEIKTEEIDPEVEKRVQEIFHPTETYDDQELKSIGDGDDLYTADVEETSEEESKEEANKADPEDKSEGDSNESNEVNEDSDDMGSEDSTNDNGGEEGSDSSKVEGEVEETSEDVEKEESEGVVEDSTDDEEQTSDVGDAGQVEKDTEQEDIKEGAGSSTEATEEEKKEE